jgi:hypothetical protein
MTLFVVFEFEVLKLKNTVGWPVCSELNGESNRIFTKWKCHRIFTNQQKLIFSNLADEFDSMFGLEFLFDPIDRI